MPDEAYISPEVDICLVVREEEDAKHTDCHRCGYSEGCLSGYATLIVHGIAIPKSAASCTPESLKKRACAIDDAVAESQIFLGADDCEHHDSINGGN